MMCHPVYPFKFDSVPEGRLPAEQQRVHPALAARLRAAARGRPGGLGVRGQLRHHDPRAEATLLPQLAEGHSGGEQGKMSFRVTCQIVS